MTRHGTHSPARRYSGPRITSPPPTPGTPINNLRECARALPARGGGGRARGGVVLWTEPSQAVTADAAAATPAGHRTPHPHLLFLFLCFKSPPLRRQPPREDGMTPSASRNDDAPGGVGRGGHRGMGGEQLECARGFASLKGQRPPAPPPAALTDGRSRRGAGPPVSALPQPPGPPLRCRGGGARPPARSAPEGRWERGRCRPFSGGRARVLSPWEAGLGRECDPSGRRGWGGCVPGLGVRPEAVGVSGVRPPAPSFPACRCWRFAFGGSAGRALTRCIAAVEERPGAGVPLPGGYGVGGGGRSGGTCPVAAAAQGQRPSASPGPSTGTRR